MALTATTASGAISAEQTTIKVASATGFAKGRLIRIDDEFLLQTADQESGSLVIPVRRGVNSTVATAHVNAALVRVGNPSNITGPSDWGGSQVATPNAYPLAGRQRRKVSISATSTLTLPPAGQDTVVDLNGTSVIALTVPVPTKDMDGDLLYIASNGAAAHTVTFTGGLSGAGANYDISTVNATAPVVLGPFMAVNGLWQLCVAVPLAGTVTNITATVA